MSTERVADEWITIEEAPDERFARAVADRLREHNVPVRLVGASGSDPSTLPGDLTVQVPLEAFDAALDALELLDAEEA
jgi:hypothetical protein